MKTILQEDISTYIRGKLNPSDQQLFEMKMENDPFLADAVEGYKLFPEAIPSKAPLKANLAMLTTVAIVGLMWMGLWWLERSLLVETRPDPVVSVDKNESTLNPTIKISPMAKRDAATIEIASPDKLPATKRSFAVPFKAIPREAPEIGQGRVLVSRRPVYRYQATFIHDLKVVSVDTTSQSELNLLPEHLPAQWESKSQFLGSKKVYTPKSTQKHYMDYALELFQKGLYEACLAQLNKVSERLPGNLNLSFYRALCHYNLEDYESAIEHFRDTQRIIHPGFYEEAKWYEALSLEKAGHTNQAKDIYTEIVDQNGFYAIRAASRLAILLQAE
jgi:hypothetical protein